jgi:hypothetical protein
MAVYPFHFALKKFSNVKPVQKLKGDNTPPPLPLDLFHYGQQPEGRTNFG